MLAFALVPTISRAMVFATGNASWAEICTSQGMKRVSVLTGEEAPVPAGTHLDHCALCGLSSNAAAPLPAAPAPLGLPVARAEVPRLLLLAARTLPVWRSAQPRGPPLVA